MTRALFAAIRAGKISGVMEALDNGADPNARDKTGVTALEAALTKDSIAITEALIAAGADVNGVDGDEMRPLDFAMLYCGHRVAKLLIERGAEVNYVRSDGDTGLIAAAGSGDAKLVEMFLAAGADPNVTRSIDGLSVADIQVIAAGSNDLPAGMKRASRKILDMLANAGATVRTAEEIDALKNARSGSATATGVIERDDPVRNELKRFKTNANSPAFRTTIEELAAFCKSPPAPYDPHEHGMHEDADGVYICRFDKAKLLAHARKKQGKFAELLVGIEEKVMGRGFYLVQNTDIDGDNVRLLFPTADPLAVLYAHAINTKGGVDLNALVGRLRKVQKLAPFVLTDCGHDTIAASYIRRISASRLGNIDTILNELCPPEKKDVEDIDFDERDTIEEIDLSIEEDRREGFFLWWD